MSMSSMNIAFGCSRTIHLHVFHIDSPQAMQISNCKFFIVRLYSFRVIAFLIYSYISEYLYS